MRSTPIYDATIDDALMAKGFEAGALASTARPDGDDSAKKWKASKVEGGAATIQHGEDVEALKRCAFIGGWSVVELDA